MQNNSKETLTIFWRFLLLGCMSFGGPVAHLGYFHHHFVEKWKWLTEERYAQLITLSQILPGPGSSQTGFAIGYHRAGTLGGFAAFLGFTLPSFIVMYCFAKFGQYSDSPYIKGVIDGLKLLAVIVVADACVKMFQKFCTQTATQLLCLISLALLLFFPFAQAQWIVLILAAVIGVSLPQLFRSNSQSEVEHIKSKWEHKEIISGALFLVLITISFFSNYFGQSLFALFYDFFQVGGLVFGGGHVVLPLLQHSIGEQLTEQTFLAGYAAAQAVPGPMFSLASYLGAALTNGSLLGALIACAGIFLPGFLLVICFFHHWQSLSQHPKLSAIFSALNACVVALLLSALYNPVFSYSVKQSSDLAWVILGWILLRILKVHILILVCFFVFVGLIFY